MASEKGFPTKQRPTQEGSFKEDHTTVQPVRDNQNAKDVVAHFYMQDMGSDAVEAGSTKKVINATAHAATRGDVLSFTSGSLLSKEVRVTAVTENTIELGEILAEAPATSDTFKILRHKFPLVDGDGLLQVVAAQGPLKFTLDGADQEVTEDTITPANNAPLPVKLTGVTGDVNITAGDLNVQLSHSGASPDSTRIGDGTEILEITASGQAQTFDSETHTKLDTLEASLTTIESDTTSIDGKITACDTTGKSTEAKQDAANALLTTIDADTSALASVDYATQTTSAALLTELQLKADLTETQPVSLASSPLPTGAATEATLASLLADSQAKADLSETQPVSAASLPLPAGAATESTLSSLDGKDFATQTTSAAILTELQLKADLSETQPVSAAALPLPSGASTEAKQDAILAAVSAPDVVQIFRNDYTSTAVTTGAPVAVTTLTSDITQMQIFDSSGQTLVMKVGGTDKFYVIPGGNEYLPVSLASGSVLTIQAVSADATSGELTINFIG